MDPEPTKLLLAELSKLSSQLRNHFASLNTKFGEQLASPSTPRPSPSASLTTASSPVAADNWGGLFDGGDDSDEQHHEAPPIVADNWGGLFDGGDDLVADDAAISNTASAESVCLHDFPCDDHDITPPCPVNLDAAATTLFPIQIKEHEGDLEEMEVGTFVESALAASWPRRAPPRPPLPRRPRRPPLRVPRLRRPRRAPPRPPRPRRPRRAQLRSIRLHRPRYRPPRPWRLRLNSTALQDAPPDGGNVGREFPLASYTVTGMAETVDNTGCFSASRLQSGSATLLHPSPAMSSPATTTASCDAIFISSGSEDILVQPDIAEDDTANIMPTRCSTQFLAPTPAATTTPPALLITQHDASQVVPKHVRILPVATMANSSKPSFSYVDVQLVSDERQQRYFDNSTPAYSIGTVLLCPAMKVSDVQEVFEGMQQRYIATATCSLGPFLWGSAIEILEGMTVQNIVVSDPLHAHGFDKEQWPPLFACNTLLLENIQGGLRFWSVVSLGLTLTCGQHIVKHRPPWPPPIHWILLIVNAQLRPIPWPSFCCHTVALQLEDFLILIGQPFSPFPEFALSAELHFSWFANLVLSHHYTQKWCKGVFPQPVSFSDHECGAILLVSETCQCNCKQLMTICLQCSFWNVCASCQFHMDRHFILWIPWKIHRLFSALISWNSYALAKMTVITSVPPLFQLASSRIEFVPRWPVIISGICLIGWIQPYLSMVITASVSNCLRRFLVGEFTFKCSGLWLQFIDKEWPGTSEWCFVLDVKVHLHQKYIGLPECCNYYEVGSTSTRWIIVRPLREFLQVCTNRTAQLWKEPLIGTVTVMAKAFGCSMSHEYWTSCSDSAKFISSVQQHCDASDSQAVTFADCVLVFTSNKLLLAASVLKIKTKYVATIRHLQAPWNPVES